MTIKNRIPVVILLIFTTILVSCTSSPMYGKPTETGVDIKTLEAMRLPSEAVSTEMPIKDTPTPLQTFTTAPYNTVTTTPVSRLAPGTIYGIEQGVYGKLLPIDEYQQAIQQIIPLDYKIPSPYFSEAIGLSNYSGQIAYITKEKINNLNQDELLRLRIGDLALQKVELVWKDWDEDLLFYEPENGDVIKIRWGPGEQSVIVQNRSNYIISSLINKNDMTFKGVCDELVWITETKQWSLACNGEAEPGVKVIVMRDGTVQAKVLPPGSIEIQIKDWAFSPDNKSVLYANPTGQLFIARPNGSTQPLPAHYQKPYRDILMRVLQWSLDGKRVLIWGGDPTQKYCPSDRTCWLVFDVNTQKVVWYPRGEALNSSSDATLSPDGKWIVLFIMNIPERYGVIVSLETNQMYKISNWLSEEVRWVK